jgi:hypothetical protein
MKDLVCTMCGSSKISVTRGIPSFAKCECGHSWERGKIPVQINYTVDLGDHGGIQTFKTKEQADLICSIMTQYDLMKNTLEWISGYDDDYDNDEEYGFHHSESGCRFVHVAKRALGGLPNDIKGEKWFV